MEQRSTDFRSTETPQPEGQELDHFVNTKVLRDIITITISSGNSLLLQLQNGMAKNLLQEWYKGSKLLVLGWFVHLINLLIRGSRAKGSPPDAYTSRPTATRAKATK